MADARRTIARVLAGPREAGTPAAEAARRLVAEHLEALGYRVTIQRFPFHPSALMGFPLLGAGCSAVYPLAVSAAAQRTDRPAAVNVAAIGQVTFIVFFLAPPLLGFVAQYLGIRNSYLICLPVIALGLLAIPALQGKAKHKGVPSVPEPLTPNG